MSWPELVTTALLGVTRRPLVAVDEPWAPSAGGEEDAVRLLDLAAAHRTLAAVGVEPGQAPAPPVAPDQHRPTAPERAVQLLEQLMERPEPTTISCWLQSCVAAERCVAPVHWTWLARATARSTRYDRALVGRALGEQGRWFVRQNPEWHRLAADMTAGALTPSPPTAVTRTPPTRPDPVQSPADLAADPERLFAQPDPWPVDWVAAAWNLLGSGVLGVRGHNYAAAVGLRMPTQYYPRLPEAAAYYLQAPEASPALRRDVRHNFVTLEQACFARVEIAAAFAEHTEQAVTVDRVEIPHV